jgi:CubicO group peptidase (beta-lactamase class C family)
MSKPTPKFPHNPAAADRVSSSSTGADRDRQFPIMSISKSFCGAVSALMAIDGKFGDKGLDATLEEVLAMAEAAHPEDHKRLEQISQYRQMLTEKGITDVRLSELLNHTSGIRVSESEPAAYKGQPISKFVEEEDLYAYVISQ